MINPIRHFAMLAAPSIHDEEAMTALELSARTAGKVNECIEAVNKNEETMKEAIDQIPDQIVEDLGKLIMDGTIAGMLNGEVADQLGADLDALDGRIDMIISESSETEGNTELIDIRSGVQNFPSAGAHVRAIANGSAFNDAVRPGTVNGDRIFAGMIGGIMREGYLMNEILSMAGRWTGGNAYYGGDLERMDHTGYTMTAQIPCSYGDTFTLESYVYGGLVRPAVVFDTAGRALEVLGNPGKGNWDRQDTTFSVTKRNAAFISFVCGVGYESYFRAYRRTVKQLPTDQNLKHAAGYLHMHAKNRTNTVTDRAQIKLAYPIGNFSNSTYFSIPMQILSAKNCSSWTFRVFAASSAETYDQQLPESSAGYTYWTGEGINVQITDIPETISSTGAAVTHLVLFVDLIADNPAEYMDIEMLIPLCNGSIKSDYQALHGALETDHLNIVRPGAALNGTYKKRLFAIGDSLMKGNTLAKEFSWLNIAAGALDMDYQNYGVNGSPVYTSTDESAGDPMMDRIEAALSDFGTPDYAIIQGGANDKRLNISIENFKAGLHTLIDAIQTKNPMCKILLATNWRRTSNANTLGLYDADYVVAMGEVGEEYGIPCINNFAEGLNLLNPKVAAWADEGIVSTGSANLHFSKAANKWIAEKYIHALAAL